MHRQPVHAFRGFHYRFGNCRVRVHRPAQFRRLPFNLPNRRLVSVRHPGEGRDLRMRHSVRNQNLFAFGVIGHRAGIADHQRRLA